MERVIKGLMGHYSVEKENKPATHVILTVDEYNNLLREIEIAEYKKNQTIEKAKEEVSKCKFKAKDIIEQQRNDAQNRIKGIQNDLDMAQREIHRINDLNANLTRIMRERANAKRGIKPKKVHHGYLVLDSQQFQQIFRWKNGRRSTSENFPCWKVRIQSPYDSSIPYETIVKNISTDLVKIFGSALGISSVYSNLDRFSDVEISKLWSNDKNFIFKTSYKANIKSGFWEIEYLVKSSIVVPEDMRTN